MDCLLHQGVVTDFFSVEHQTQRVIQRAETGQTKCFVINFTVNFKKDLLTRGRQKRQRNHQIGRYVSSVDVTPVDHSGQLSVVVEQ